jgi:RNA polymerase sigma-70 factor (ECF subfamily)
VRRVCPPWLSAQADDIVQVAVLRVVEIARRGEGTGGFRSSYLWRVAYSVTVDEIRRLRRRREVGLEDAAAATDLPGFDPERRQAAARTAQGVRTAWSAWSRTGAWRSRCTSRATASPRQPPSSAGA